MAGVLNLCFSIFKEFLLSAPFFRGLRRRDSGKNEEKSFTKLRALDCWFSRTNDQRLNVPDHILVQNENMAASLALLCKHLNEQMKSEE